jgi:23S rRNA pseudouridine2605 synthase
MMAPPMRRRQSGQRRPNTEQLMANGDIGSSERLQKVLSRAGVCSRRAAEAMIADGRVKVNGTVVSAQGLTVDVRTDVINVDSKRITFDSVRAIWMAVYKPKGYISTDSDSKGRKTVVNLVKNATQNNLVPVGRLDNEATGLILLTNEKAHVHLLTHASSLHVREYLVDVEGIVDNRALVRLREGLILDGDTRPTLPAVRICFHLHIVFSPLCNPLYCNPQNLSP